MVFVCYFFYKQKTAYELRISDWSSDVCSSDLTLAVQAVVEHGDHLVFAVEAGVDVHERAQSVQAQHREALLGERAEIAARALHPPELDRLARHRVGVGALGGGVAGGVGGVRSEEHTTALQSLMRSTCGVFCCKN